MKKFVLIFAFFTIAASLISWHSIIQTKPGNNAVTALKLAEAKAILSKANTKNIRSNLSTADGGI